MINKDLHRLLCRKRELIGAQFVLSVSYIASSMLAIFTSNTSLSHLGELYGLPATVYASTILFVGLLLMWDAASRYATIWYERELKVDRLFLHMEKRRSWYLFYSGIWFIMTLTAVQLGPVSIMAMVAYSTAHLGMSGISLYVALRNQCVNNTSLKGLGNVRMDN